MLDILSITGTIFVLMGVGFLSVRLKVFFRTEMATLGKFVVNLALPALILHAVSSRSIGEIANIGYLGAVLLGSLAVYALGYLWLRRVAGTTTIASTFGAMGMSCANSGFIGYPVVLMALPDVAATALALNMIVENLVMIPLVLVIAEYASGGEIKGRELTQRILFRLLRNPIVIALALGLAISISSVTFPIVIERPVEIMASASAAISLVVIGGTLATLPLRKVDMQVVSVVFGKLVLHPAAVALGFLAMSLIGFRAVDERLVTAAIIMTATPVMAIYPILALHYGEERTPPLAMLVMTVLSFITISAAMAISLQKCLLC